VSETSGRDAPTKPVYLLTGSDRPKVELALERLRGHFPPEATEVVSALDTPAEAAVAFCNAGSLFGDARLVAVEHVDGRRDSDNRLKGGWKAADVDAISTYLASPAPGTVLALVGEDVKKTAALWKACAKAGEVLEYAVAKNAVQKWVADRFARHGVRAEPEACAALVHIVGENLHALALEVDKLATWAAGEPIGEREVELLAAPAAETPIFALTDAWAAGDTARVLGASETIFERETKPRRDTAARLAGALGGHLGKMRALKRLTAEGVRPREAAGKLKMHPFYAEKVSRQADGLSAEQLRAASARLAELDGALKGRSKLAPDLEIQRALVDLTRRPGGRVGSSHHG
jgi:DNA polymerase III subunit delta